MQLKLKKVYRNDLTGKRSMRVVRHAKSGIKSAKMIRLYIGGACYADVEATVDNFVAATYWIGE